ncbi:MAG: cysteine hydrolase [Spirochaetales bacterium]|nr:cysteine hydrolase [Spirochaetales bacterium]
MKQALLVIDYIECCCIETYRDPQLNLGLSKVREIAPSLEKLVTFYRTKHLGEVIWVTCCPWVKGYVHPTIELFYEENPEARFYSNTLEGNGFYMLTPENDEQVFKKNLYSAFSGTGGLLHKYLQEKQIKHLIMTGIYSTGCVNATVCEAFHHGYKLTIIRDCVETFDYPGKQEYQEYLLVDWSYMYGKVVKLDTFMKGP